MSQAKLTVGAALWIEGSKEDLDLLVLETERTDKDEVAIKIGEVTIYMSVNAAVEVGRQLVARSNEKPPR